MNRVSLFFIRMYQVLLSQFLGGNCRFYPSCSEYAKEAFEKKAFFKAMKMTFLRLLKCYPGGPSGFDPVERGTP